MTAPERIWVTGIGKGPTAHWWHSGTVAGATEYIRADLATPAAMTPEVAALVEALEGLLDATTAENRFGDRALTITGPTANLKWLIDAQDEAHAALAALRAGGDA